MAEGSPRILVVRRSSLGDIVVTLPFLVALRRRYPQAHIAWLVEKHLADLVRGHECLDEVITVRDYSARRWLQFLWESRRVGRQLAARHFDWVLDLQGRMKSALLCWYSRAPRRVGFSDGFWGLPGWRMLTETVLCPPGTPAVPRSLLMAHYLGAPPEPVEFRYPVLPEARTWAEVFLAERGLADQPLAALVLGASQPNKCWPPDYFAELVQALRRSGQAEPVLIGGRGEREREAQVLAALDRPVASAVGRTSLPQLAALLARTRVVVAGDTGGLHVAAALGRPVVGLYGPTSPVLSGPYGAQHRVLWDQPACGPCHRRPTCEAFDCMRALTPARVARAVEEILAAGA